MYSAGGGTKGRRKARARYVDVINSNSSDQEISVSGLPTPQLFASLTQDSNELSDQSQISDQQENFQ